MHSYQKRETGQTLVIVALAMTVLLLMVGLAVDVGLVYNERRNMQNAADAGALAGAQKLCEGTDSLTAQSTAEYVAHALNGSDEEETTATVTGFTVNVVAGTQAQLYFFRLINMDSFPVSAEAEAVCACADSVGYAWPVAFDITQWDWMDCENEDGDPVPSASFMVWADDTKLNLEEGQDLCDVCDCDRYQETTGRDIRAFGATPLEPGARGWVQLKVPTQLKKDFPPQTDSCGSPTLDYWLRNGYPGTMAVGQCVPTEQGSIASLLDAAASRTGDIVSIIIYDKTLSDQCTLENTVGYSEDKKQDYTCPGSPYYITGFGCVRIEFVEQNFSLYGIADDGFCEIGAEKINNKKVIFATRMCECAYTGEGAAGPVSPVPGCVVAASLTK